MYEKTVSFSGALLAMWQGKNVGRKAWGEREGITILPHGIKGDGTSMIIAFTVGDTSRQFHEWSPTTADILATDWFLHP